MDAMAALTRTGPSLAATGHRSSASLRPSASLSFPSASSRSRRVGLSTAAWSGRAARVARVTPSRIVASSEIEQSYIMIKPDGVQRGLVGEIISRFEKKGFLLKGLKLFQCPKELAQVCLKNALNISK
ncbi:hypothetical protein ACQ4PT_022300 [Festuca glaucescens]